MAPTQGPAVIVGGGFAGLLAARELRAQGREVQLFEAGPRLAGLATSFHDDDGFSYDFGAHFITNRLAREIGVLDRCRTVRHYGETVFLGGRTYGYPFGLMRVPRYLRDAVKARLDRKASPGNAAEWFRHEYGTALADEVALPLIEAWSGAPAAELSTAVGDKIPGGIAQTIFLRIAARVTKRAVAIGYCNEAPQSAKVWHVYPEGGVSTLCEHLAAPMREAINLDSPVERIIVENDRAVGVRVGGSDIEASVVISTAPVNVLPKLVEGTAALERFRAFRYRPMIFVNMRLEGRGVLPDVITWTPESGFPFFRLTEATLSMPWLAPEGKTLLTVDIGAEVGDKHWTMSDDDLGDYCCDHLQSIIPDIGRRYLGARVLRTPIAYPVFLNEYESDRRMLERTTGVEGLLSIGRNGEFAHILMEDTYWRTLRRLRPTASQ